ncbi:MAG: hypothetical protein WC384_02415 [Prolixibacteraceae bacterium]|jgi:hypothetical protein
MKKYPKNPKPINLPTTKQMRLLDWLANLDLSGSQGDDAADSAHGAESGSPRLQNLNLELKEFKPLKFIKMKTENRLLKRLAMMLLIVAGTIGAWAQAPSGLSQSGDHAVCLGETKHYGVNPTANTTYNWTITPLTGGNGTSTPGATPNLLTIDWNAVGTARLELTETNATSCLVTVSIVVTVYDLPLPAASSNSPVCVGNDLLLTGAPDGMTTYAWTGPNGFTSNQQSPAITGVTAAASGDYTLTVTNGNGCAASATTTVVINDLPLPTASSNSPVCVGNDLVLTGAPDGMTTYGWTGPNGFTSNQQSPAITGVTASASGDYTLTVTNENGCTASATTTVVINDLPLPAASSNSPVCVGNDLVLTGAPDGMTTYDWTGPNGFTSNQQSPTITGVTATASGDYTLTVTNGNGCTASVTTNVVINPLPTPLISGTDPICGGDDETYSTTDSGNSYIWTVVGGSFTGQGTNQITVTWDPTLVITSGTVSVEETIGTSGCKATDTKTIVINPKPTTDTIWHD